MEVRRREKERVSGELMRTLLRAPYVRGAPRFGHSSKLTSGTSPFATCHASADSSLFRLSLFTNTA